MVVLCLADLGQELELRSGSEPDIQIENQIQHHPTLLYSFLPKNKGWLLDITVDAQCLDAYYFCVVVGYCIGNGFVPCGLSSEV